MLMSRHNRIFNFLAFFLSVALSAVQILPVYGQETEPEDAKPPEVTEQGSSENNLSEPDPQAVPSDSSDSESAQKESELPEEKTENSQDGTDQNSNSPSDSSEANTQDDVKPPAVENNAESVREEEPPADRSENTELEKENKNNQNLYTLSASEGALKLSVKGSFDTKPDEIKMKIEKIPADAEHEKKTDFFPVCKR